MKQGGVLSTGMLTIFMNDKIQMLMGTGMGASIGERKVPVIAYADDEVLISTSPTELQHMLDVAYKHSCMWRYKYNAAKSKVIVYGSGPRNKWRLGEDPVDETEEYYHLGIVMSPRSAAKKRIENCMNRARRALYARSIHGMNIRRTSPLTLYTTWKIYAEPILSYSLAVTSLGIYDMLYLEGMVLRLYRMMQGLPSRTQKAVVYAMLGAPSCRLFILKITMQFIGFLLRAASEHELTYYIILHGVLNNDRGTSLVRQWNVMLEELQMPNLTDVLQNKDMGAITNNWSKLSQQALMNFAWNEAQEAGSKLISVHWLPRLITRESVCAAPELFWPTSRYSNIRRQATLTKINLLTGHSWVATGLIRRHAQGSQECPLCQSATETLEHLLFECTELLEERAIAQEKYNAHFTRNTTAVSFLLQANTEQTLAIHYVYTARVRRALAKT